MNSLYFIAMIPPEEVCRQATIFKEEIANLYESKKALRVIPHITLKAPFTISGINDDKVLQWFNTITPNTGSFIVLLNGFGCFDNPKNPVIYIKPLPSTPMFLLQDELVHSFQKQFPEILIHPLEKKFSPHMTIAYRDLSYDAFKKAWPAFKGRPYSAQWLCRSFCLLKHDGTQWHVVAEKLLVAGC